MKEYIVNGKHYLYKEGEQPAGAVEFKKEVKPEIKTSAPTPEIKPQPQPKTAAPDSKAKPQSKAVTPANKARETKKK